MTRNFEFMKINPRKACDEDHFSSSCMKELINTNVKAFISQYFFGLSVISC